MKKKKTISDKARKKVPMGTRPHDFLSAGVCPWCGEDLEDAQITLADKKTVIDYNRCPTEDCEAWHWW